MLGLDPTHSETNMSQFVDTKGEILFPKKMNWLKKNSRKIHVYASSVTQQLQSVVERIQTNTPVAPDELDRKRRDRLVQFQKPLVVLVSVEVGA